MAETFLNILTIIGQQKKAVAETGGAAVNITHFKVGDSNGTYYTPLETQTDLVHPTYTGSFTDNSGSQIIVNPSALNEVLYKCFIPADVGGFTVRELGLFDAENSLILICKLPAQDKFALDSGLFQPLTFTPKIIYTNPVTQAVLTPSSQIIATQTFVTQQIANMNISDFSRTIQQNIIDRLAQIISPQSIKRLIFFDETGSTTTLKDRSLNSSNATLSANASTLSPVEIENCRTLNLSNSASVEFNDADDLSFTDGTNDKPFTLIALINPNSVNNGHILSKNDLTSASYKREYVFYFDAFNKLHGRIYDNASGAYLDRFYDTQITGDIGNFHTYMMTYDGSKTSTGLKLYRDGIKVDNQGVNSGSYSIMVNTAAKLGNFYVNTTKQAIGNYRGALIAIISETLSTAEVKDLDIVLRSYVGLDVPASGELTGHAFDPNAHNSIFTGKSDVGHIHDDRYYTETETDNIIERLFPLYAKPLAVLNGNTNSSTGFPNIINKISDTEVSFLVGGIYKNLIITDSKCKKYEISSIANVTLPTDAGTYKFLIDFADITLQENGTYHAIVNAVKLSYYYNGLIPAISMATNGYAVLYNGSQSWNPYNLVNGLNTGVYMYGGGVGCGGAYTYDHSLIGNVIAIDSANNKITFAGEHVSTLYGTNQVLLDNSGSPGAVSYTFSNPVYDSGNNTTTITLTGYYYGGWDGSGSNYNLYYAGLSAGYVTSALFLNKPVYTKALSTFVFNVPYLSLANSFLVQNADSAGAQVAISISSNGGNTYQTHSIVTLSTGLNTITINQNFNSIKFSFIPRGWYWDDGGGQYWIHHEYRLLNISNININMTVSFAGGAVTQDYVYPAAPIDGDYFTLINQIPYICSKWINSTRVDGRDYVLMGEANRQTSNGVLGTPRTYAFNRKAHIKTNCPSSITVVPITHNLGTDDIKLTPYLVCKTAELGYSVGQKARPLCPSSQRTVDLLAITDKNTVTAMYGNEGIGVNKLDNTGIWTTVAPAKWDLEITAEANW